MNKVLICGVLVVCIIILLKNQWEGFSTTRVCNNLDGRCHRVPTSHSKEKSQESSLMIAKINMFCIEFLRRLREKYLFHKQGTAEQQSIIMFLLSNYDPHTFVEHIPKDESNNSYVKNKGEEFGLCIREKQSGQDKLHDFNTIQFVILHELSHLASRGIGHGHEFFKNFKMLLQDAHSFGLYNPVDYSKKPIQYCNIMLTSNPYYLDTIPNY